MPARCVKVPYASRADAQRAAAKIGHRHVYSCKWCGYWHLTTSTPREVRRRRRGKES